MGAIDYICVICDERVELTSYLQHLNSHSKCARCTLRLCPNMDTCAVEEPASKKFRGNHEKVILCPIRECSARFALPNKFQRHHTSKHSDKGKETLSCKEDNCSFSTIYRESLATCQWQDICASSTSLKARRLFLRVTSAIIKRIERAIWTDTNRRTTKMRVRLILFATCAARRSNQRRHFRGTI